MSMGPEQGEVGINVTLRSLAATITEDIHRNARQAEEDIRSTATDAIDDVRRAALGQPTGGQGGVVGGTGGGGGGGRRGGTIPPPPPPPGGSVPRGGKGHKIRRRFRSYLGRYASRYATIVAASLRKLGFGRLSGRMLPAATAATAVRWGTARILDTLIQPAVQASQFFMGPAERGVTSEASQTGINAAAGAAGGAVLGSFLFGMPVVGAIVGVSAALVRLPQQIMEWSESLLKSKEGIAQFSGEMFGAYVVAQAMQIRRDIESAQRTGAAIADLTYAHQALLDQLQPYKDRATNVYARSLATIEERMAGGIALNKYMPHTLITDAIWGYQSWLQKRGQQAFEDSTPIGWLIKLGKYLADISENTKLTAEEAKRSQGGGGEVFGQILNVYRKPFVGAANVPRK